MDSFERFWGVMEEEELGIPPEKRKEVISRILKEFDLKLKSVNEIEDGGNDLLAVCSDKLGKEVTSLIRIWTESEGVEKYEVEDLYEDMIKRKSTTAIFITASYFFNDAKDFAKELPIKLIGRIKLSEIIIEIEAIKSEKAFVSDISDGDVVRYFQRMRKGKTLSKFGLVSPEDIEKVDRRYAPIGFFSLIKVDEAIEDRKFAYIDLSSGDILYIDEGLIKKDGFLRRILNLPKKSQEYLMYLVEHGELHHEHFEGRYLTILKKRGLILEYEKKKRGFLGGILAEVMDVIVEIAGQLGEVVSTAGTTYTPTKTTASPTHPPVKKRVRAEANIPPFDQPYNLENFMMVSNASEKFDPDPRKYEPEEIGEILSKTTGYEAKFEYMIHFPYYLCRFSSRTGDRHRRLYSASFKKFFPRAGSYGLLHHIINKYPELFYLLLVALYIGYNIGKPEGLPHIFSSAFIFTVICGVVGTLLKASFKTERTAPYYGVSIFRYGFPSMHSMVAVGAVGFVYFIEPIGHLLSVVLIPVALVYGYSRVRIGAHTVADVVGGGIIGLIIGILSGMYLLDTHLPDSVEMILTALFLLTPFISLIIRSKYIH